MSKFYARELLLIGPVTMAEADAFLEPLTEPLPFTDAISLHEAYDKWKGAKK